MAVERATQSLIERLRSEAGVSLIHVALLLFVLMGLSVLVTDMGVVWLARDQAQSAADAGALAGAAARAYDELTDPPAANGAAYQSAYATAHANRVVGEDAATDVLWNCPEWYAGVTQRCVQVDVYRDGTHGSTRLPAFFSVAFPGAPDALMKIRVSATARVRNATTTDCFKPWLIPDKWNEVTPPADTFNGADTYTAPGYTVLDIGTEMMTLSPGNPADAATPSNYYGIGAASDYKPSIEGCELVHSLTDVVTSLPGLDDGTTQSGVQTLLANGPVVVAVGLFSPVEWMSLARESGKFDLHVSNIMGFRITDVQANGNIYGTIAAVPGTIAEGAPEPTGPGAFLKEITLIR